MISASGCCATPVGSVPTPTPAAMRRGIAELLARCERAARRRRTPLVAGLAVALVLALSLVAGAAYAYILRAPGTIREGYAAVRTQAGRPLAFASVTQRGARLFVASHCWRD